MIRLRISKSKLVRCGPLRMAFLGCDLLQPLFGAEDATQRVLGPPVWWQKPETELLQRGEQRGTWNRSSFLGQWRERTERTKEMKRPLSPAHVSPRNQTQEICKLLQILSLPMTCYEALMRSHNLSKFQFSSYKMGVSVDCWVIAGLTETLVSYGTKVPWLINVCGYRYFAGSPEDPARQELAVHTFSTVKTPWVVAPPTLGAFPCFPTRRLIPLPPSAPVH